MAPITPEDKERLQACIQEMSEILYRNTPVDALKTLETIEQTVRAQMLEQVSPKVGVFFIKTATGTTRGKVRTLKSCLGILPTAA